MPSDTAHCAHGGIIEIGDAFDAIESRSVDPWPQNTARQRCSNSALLVMFEPALASDQELTPDRWFRVKHGDESAFCGNSNFSGA